MERVDAKSSPRDRFAASTRTRKLVPDPQGHAALLVQTYGRDRALQIAQANRSLMRSDEYWGDVFQALQGADWAAIVAASAQGKAGEEHDLRHE